MKLKTPLALALGLILSIPGFAQEPEIEIEPETSKAAPEGPGTEVPPAEAPADPFKVDLLSEHTFRLPYSVYPESWGFDGEQKVPSLKNDLQLTAGNSTVKVISRWNLEAYPFSPVQDPQTWRLKPLENAIYWSPAFFKLGAGWQTYAWGSADGKNPTDTLNPRDYSVGLNSEKIPVFSVSASWYPVDGVTLDTVYIPYTQADIFPMDPASGIPDTLFQDLTVPGLEPRSVIDSTVLSQDPRAYTLGGRARLKAGEWDLAASYVYGWDTFATPKITFKGSAPYQVTNITLERLRLHRLGLNAKTTVDAFGLWLETGLDITGNPAADSYKERHPKLSWTLGGDVSFGESSQYYLNLQYFGEYIVNYDKDFNTDYINGQPLLAKVMTDPAYMEKFYYRALTQSLASQNQGLAQGLVFNLKLPFAENLITTELTGAVAVPFYYDDVNEKRLVSAGLNPEIDIMPVDSFHIILGASLAYTWVKDNQDNINLKIKGDSIGTYTPGNKVYLQAVYKWTQDLGKKE